MENNFKDEEPTIKIINNNKALQYKVKYNGKNIMKIPAYKQWLDLMKTEKGDNGIICYCIIVIYFIILKIMNKKITTLNVNMIWQNFANIVENFILMILFVVIELL